MGFDLYYKVRAIKTKEGKIEVTEKGLLRHLTVTSARETLKEKAREELASSNRQGVCATYAPGPYGDLQINFIDLKKAEEIGFISTDRR